MSQPSTRPWVCRTLGCKPRRGPGGYVPYGKVSGGVTDGMEVEHYLLHIECGRCGTPLLVGRFHGPLGRGAGKP